MRLKNRHMLKNRHTKKRHAAIGAQMRTKSMRVKNRDNKKSRPSTAALEGKETREKKILKRNEHRLIVERER
jgi:hypothetical protein